MRDKKEAAPTGNRAAPHQSAINNHNDRRLDFQAINRAAMAVLPALLLRWLPDGRRVGGEWTARNPRRADHHAGSFKINLRTARWADFATGDCGGDVISLAAYLSGSGQAEAAARLAFMLGLWGAP